METGDPLRQPLPGKAAEGRRLISKRVRGNENSFVH